MTAIAQPQPWRGLVAGIIAGLTAAAVMNAFQAIAAKSMSQGQQGEPATEKAADKASQLVQGKPFPRDDRPLAGEAVHYLTGAAIGGAYGLLAEYYPKASAGFGSAYGIATSLVLDDAVVPALDLGTAPWKTSPATHAYGASSHAVFGLALEAIRRLFGGRV
jgi:hypothetical protein